MREQTPSAETPRNGAILVLNSGSSSLKYRWFGMPDESVLATGLIERIGETGSATGIADHRAAIAALVDRLETGAGLLLGATPDAIGHRVVHGGERFNAPVLVNEEVLAAIRATIPLAPLHNPANLLGIEACREHWPGVPQVAVFDTAFHQTMPPAAYRYALPEAAYRDLHVRRYGFHGTSFAYLTRSAAQCLGKPPEDANLVLLHLGNGASACAVRAGKSVDTSMGMTPTAGLVMGSRSGDLDPGVFPYLLRQGFAPERVETMLNRDSGLLGVCGANDMRVVLARAAQGESDAGLALEMYVYRIRKYIGAYCAVLGRVDALVFSGGVGEHAAEIRAMVCAGLEGLGLVLDMEANRHAGPDAAEIQDMEANRHAGPDAAEIQDMEANRHAGPDAAEIQAASSGLKILVIPTDEEREIARQTWRLAALSPARVPPASHTSSACTTGSAR